MQVSSRDIESMRARSRSPLGRHVESTALPFARQRAIIPRRVVRAVGHKAYPKWRNQESTMHMNAYPYMPSSRQLHKIWSDDAHVPNALQPTDNDDSAHLSFEWNEMMTFRTFVIMRTEEETDVTEAVQSFEKYKKAFIIEREPNLLWRVKNFPVIKERYHAEITAQNFEVAAKHAVSAAALFIKIFKDDQLIGVNLIDQTRDYASIEDTAHSKKYILKKFENEAVYTPLTAPLWMIPDPNLNCLHIRKLPAHISKWDIHQLVSCLVTPDTLLDVTVTEPSNFQLDLQGGHPKRSAWIQFTSAEACATAGVKLERAMLKNFVLHPLARVPFPEKYTVSTTVSEASHPARILRDLTLSARLILKLDSLYGVSDTSENGTLNQDTFEAMCARHPILHEFQQVVNGLSRSPEEQLDLQILYLRMVHSVCYYSGRQFASPRHLWEVAGPLYVRPRVDVVELIERFPDFRSIDGDGWDNDYIQARDLLDPEALAAAASDRLFTSGHSPPFEPIEVTIPAKDTDISIKKESLIGDSFMDDSSVPSDAESDSQKVKSFLMEESQIIDSCQRGRQSEWLQVLDNRIAGLLLENPKTACQPITSDSPVIEKQWTEFCNKVIHEIAFEKWRCGLCSKMFRGVEYVKKHLKNKHSNHLDNIISEANDRESMKRYQSDPFRLPIAPPIVVPYLYRRGLPNYHQYEISNISVYARKRQDHTLNGSKIKVPGSRQKAMQYRDLDAPRSTINEDTDLREFVSYDDI